MHLNKTHYHYTNLELEAIKHTSCRWKIRYMNSAYLKVNVSKNKYYDITHLKYARFI